MNTDISINNETATDGKKLTQQLADYEERLKFFQDAIGTLLVFIKEFSLDLQEIDSDGFKEEIESLGEKLNSDQKTKKINSILNNYKKIILDYIERLKRYIGDREYEFKKIIDLLTKAMASVDSNNQVFNRKIYEQSNKIEQITLLDDIKKIKSALTLEIENVRKTIKDKQLHDENHLAKLSKQVDLLNVELEKAKEDSLTDGLTGLYNRLAFDRKMKSLEDRNIVTETPFSLLLFDIDNFKKINDTYGHPIGDRVILALAQKCREFTRKEDYIARYGGDEFAIIMLGASLKNAVRKAKQLSKAVSSTRYAIESVEGYPELAFSISIGVSVCGKGDLGASVIERADKALYAAKHSGKACVFSEKDVK